MRERQIVNSQEMKQLDKLTIKENNITSFELLQQAGGTIFNHICRNGLCDSTESVAIIAGPGNNGGDALVVGYHFFEQGLNPAIIIIGKEDDQSTDSLKVISKLEERNYPYHRVYKIDDLIAISEFIDNASLIIDGIFGIGLRRNVEGIFSEIISMINNSYAKKISIDIPSGLNANNGLMMSNAVKADHTIVIQNYKQGNLLNDALDYSGEITLLDVGIIQTIFPENQQLLAKSYLKNKIPKRKQNSYKYTYGNTLTIGGSNDMMGAPLMCGFSALRTGTGLSHLLYLSKYTRLINNIYPELMIDTYDGIEEIPSKVKRKTTVIFGPGLGKNDNVNLEVLSYLLSLDIPLLIDADGIYYLKKLIPEYSNRHNIIITPHYKEMADFLSLDISDVQEEPILLAKNIAHKYNLTVVLKGTCTIITNNEETFFSVNGNPGLATAGTGDILSGIIGSLMGRGFSPLEASKLGVLIHAMAAEHAVNDFGEESLIATDILKYIPLVLKNAKT